MATCLQVERMYLRRTTEHHTKGKLDHQSSISTTRLDPQLYGSYVVGMSIWQMHERHSSYIINLEPEQASTAINRSTVATRPAVQASNSFTASSRQSASHFLPLGLQGPNEPSRDYAYAVIVALKR